MFFPSTPHRPQKKIDRDRRRFDGLAVWVDSISIVLLLVLGLQHVRRRVLTLLALVMPVIKPKGLPPRRAHLAS